MNDGGCDEFINLRYRNGAYRPVGEKQYAYPAPNYEEILVHRQDDFENWVGYDEQDGKIEHYNPSSLEVIQELVTVSGDLYEVRALKSYLLVTTSEETLIFLFNGESYAQIDLFELDGKFDVNLFPALTLNEETETATDAEGLVGKYLKKVNELSEDSKFIGGLAYRVALKLFDGSYIFHTVPKYFQIADHKTTLTLSGGNYKFTFAAVGAVNATALINTLATSIVISDLSSIVSSISLFFSQTQPLYEVSEDTITDDDLNTWLPTDGSIELGDVLEVTEEFKNLPDQPAWYLVGEVSLDELEQQDPPFDYIYSKAIDLDLEGFYQNYATRRTLPVDNFSHHKNTGLASFVYNDRFIIGNTRQVLANPLISVFTPAQPLVLSLTPTPVYVEYVNDEVYQFKAVVTLNTSNGIKTVIQGFPGLIFKNPTIEPQKAVFFNGILGYFDQRATSIEILIEISGSYYSLFKKDLRTSVYGNFSYIENKNYDPAESNGPSVLPRRYDVNLNSTEVTFNINELPDASTLPDENTVVIDNNNVQISEVANPFVFLAENYQQVSEGSIIAFGSNTDPISLGQFGQYPIYTFTSVGTWALEIGLGDIFVTRVVPLNREVLTDPKAKVDISFGIVYATAEGLKLLGGKEVLEISETVEGLPESNFIDNAQLQQFLNLPQTVQVQDIVDKVPFSTYLQGARIGYNKSIDNSEILVANSNYNYAYVFDIKHKKWYKLPGKYTILINLYPELYAVAPGEDINLLTNGDFEDPTWETQSAPPGWSSAGTQPFPLKESGNTRMLLENVPYVQTRLVYQDLSAQPFTRYTLDFDYFVDENVDVDLRATIRISANQVNYQYDGANWTFGAAPYTYKVQSGVGSGGISIDLPETLSGTLFIRVGFNNAINTGNTGADGYSVDNVRLYPTVNPEGSVRNMSSEVKSNVPCYFHTKPLSLGNDDAFKKLRRSFLRGFLNMASGKYAAMYMFGSDDLQTWEFITGNDRNSGKFKDIWVTHSRDSKRFYIFVFAAEIDFDPNVLDTYIKTIEIEHMQKWTRKIR